MLIEDGILLYHGSYADVSSIDLEMSEVGKDFGKGFYLTQNRSQAKKFIGTSIRKAVENGMVDKSRKYGFVNTYAFDLDLIGNIKRLNIFEFKDTSKDWLWFIAKNRKSSLTRLLKNKIDKKLENADIIVGKIANDTTNPVLTAYLSGLYGDILSESTIQIVIDLLLPNKLDYQYCFKTERAIECLRYIGAKKYEI